MTAATGRIPNLVEFGHPVPIALPFALAASQAPKKFWLMGINSSGYATSMSGANLISGGVAELDSDGSTTAGLAATRLNCSTWSGYANGTSTDALAQSDIGRVAWASDNATVGKLSNLSGANRSMAGLFLGLSTDNASGTSAPIVFVGPVGWTLARAAHVANNVSAFYSKAVDGGAATDLGEVIIARDPVHGLVTAVELQVEGTTLAASGTTDYKTITVSKRDGAGGNAVVIATVDTKTTAFTQWTTVAFTLASNSAGALNLLETDILTVQESHGGSGAIIPAGKLRVVTKVQ